MPIAEKQSAFLFSSASETIIPYGGLSSNGKPSAVCSFIECPCSKPCFYPPINERECSLCSFWPTLFFSWTFSRPLSTTSA